jgi:predicted RND superfamily exporter protein
LLLLAFALVIAGYIFGKQLPFDHSIERMFVRNDPVLEPYDTLQRYLGGNEIVLAVYEDPDLLAADGRGLDRLSAVAERLAKLSGVDAALSLADLNRALVTCIPWAVCSRASPTR